MKKVKEDYKAINSTVARLSLVAIQIVIAISVFQFVRFVFFHDISNWQLNVVVFCRESRGRHDCPAPVKQVPEAG